MEQPRSDLSLALVRDPSPASPSFRTMPANEEAEQALLGALLTNPEALDRVSDFLRADHFYYPAHGRIYGACLTLRDQGRRADPVTLKAAFEQDGDLKDLGGARYLAELAAGIHSVVNVFDYARTIHDLHLRRQLILIGEETVNDAYDHDVEVAPSEQIQGAEEKLYSLASEGDYRRDFVQFGEVLKTTLDNAAKALNRDTALTGVTTGLSDLDRWLGGLQPSDLIIIAGRPSMGKTALATNIAFNAAKAYQHTGGREGAVVGFFSLEMSSDQLATRILSEESRIPSETIRKGDMAKRDFPRLVEASHTISQIPLFIDDTAGLTISTLRTRAMRLKRQHNLGLVVVDYLQLMRPPQTSRGDNRVQEISEITRGLKIVAKDLNVPVIALSQLSRKVEDREDKRPQLADLRESGSIEQDADVVLFVFREAYYVGKSQPMEGTSEHADWQAKMERINHLAEAIIAKQRHGPTGKVDLHFEGAFTRFSNLDRRHGIDGSDFGD
ncbi:MAG: replicative DNA helicase [Inquilinaceae bacterium]